MKRILLLLSLILSVILPTTTHADCFLVKENDKVIVSEGDCQSRHAPRCSFNIAISLMGYNEGLLIDELHPELPFLKGYPDYVEKWKQTHNPSLWMKNSCYWYSLALIKQLGMKKFKEYVVKFRYGTQDVSGDKGKNNGLTRSWMSGSSLRISPEEQTIFLQNLIGRKLQVTPHAYEMTKNIILVGDLIDGWKLYGKTGTGNLPKGDGTLDERHEGGGFVGWVEKDKRAIVFAHYIEQEVQDTPAGLRAKEIAKEKMIKIVQSRK
jgi:beta-lactamase class D